MLPDPTARAGPGHAPATMEKPVKRPAATVTAILLLLASGIAGAAPRYVTDELRISVRTGQGTQYRIVEVIDSGTQVETLADEGDWVRVRTPEGNTGWVLGQYLTETPIAADRLERARADLEAATTRVADLEQALADARGRIEALRERNASLEDELQAAREKLSRAEEGLRLEEENQRLAQEVTRLEQQVSELRTRAARLADQRRREWFLAGAGVLLGGVLFGILVTRIPWRRGRRDRLF
jgi:SH3 domain protein